MTASPDIDVRDLGSVRRAAADAGVVIGGDWAEKRAGESDDISEPPRSLFGLRRSPIARKIITFNLLALIVLVAGVMYLSPSRDNLVYQRAAGLVNEAELMADVFEAQLPLSAPVNMVTGDGIDAAETLRGLDVRGGVEVFVFDANTTLIASAIGAVPEDIPTPIGLEFEPGSTVLTDALSRLYDRLSGLFGDDSAAQVTINTENRARNLARQVLQVGTSVETYEDPVNGTVFVVGTPIFQGDTPIGVISVASAAGELDGLVRAGREVVLQMFVVGAIVSIGLSLLLASTIANPLADLASAAEVGHSRNARKMAATRVRIPDLTARPDEIGRLSGALRGMVAALYDRIEGNEQFAADVAHEIKNPLASLRSAIGTLRIAKRDDQRERLLEVIEHDVQRLDRLVSDISNASRLDSELVKEAEERFDLVNMVRNLSEYLGHEAAEKGVEFILDVPETPVFIFGLEGRLAQVIVNLISNAISFCTEGDAIRVWIRQRENRVLVVVEDTGPGIPDNALQKIFQRFYSERPEQQFGKNSGLGLAISKQIVEAHGGVIWAENIRPSDAAPDSPPLGARFVVGLPL